MNHFFISIILDLGLKKTARLQVDPLEIWKAFLNVVRTIIAQNVQKVTKDEVCQEIITLNGSKATMYRDIPTDILKSSVNLHLDFVTDIINKFFRDGEFPKTVIYTEVLPVSKKKDHHGK